MKHLKTCSKHLHSRPLPTILRGRERETEMVKVDKSEIITALTKGMHRASVIGYHLATPFNNVFIHSKSAPLYNYHNIGYMLMLQSSASSLKYICLIIFIKII